MVVLRWICRFLTPSLGLRAYAHTRVWNKARRIFGRLRFLRQVAALYYCAIDPRTPLGARAFALLAVLYFILPIDVIPDAIPVIGLIDDGIIVAATLRVLGRYVTAEHYRRAEGWPWAHD